MEGMKILPSHSKVVVKKIGPRFRDFTLSRELGEIIKFACRVLLGGHVLA